MKRERGCSSVLTVNLPAEVREEIATGEDALTRNAVILLERRGEEKTVCVCVAVSEREHFLFLLLDFVRGWLTGFVC